jgi:hypothetical protein
VLTEHHLENGELSGVVQHWLAQDSTYLVPPIEQYVAGPVDRPSIY